MSRWAQHPAAVGDEQASLVVVLPVQPSSYIHSWSVVKMFAEKPQLALAEEP